MNVLQRALQNLHGLDGLDCRAYGHLIQQCTVRCLVGPAKQLHVRLVLFSVTPGNFLASKLINFHSKTSNLNHARKELDQIPHRNAFSWNAMLIAFPKFTVTCVLKALGALLPGSKLAKEVHCFVLRLGFDSDVFVVNSLITYYSRCDEGDVEFRHVGLTLISFLQACLQSNDLMLGMEVHQFLNENQIETDVFLCNTRCGSLDYAQELCAEMSEKDEVTYGSLVSGTCFTGLLTKPWMFFETIRSRSYVLWNAVIYVRFRITGMKKPWI
ncbi:hypothetical protein ACFX2I_019487 [Malus domestica]